MLAICHTSYSLQAGVRTAREWASAAAALGYCALVVADVNGLFGAVHFHRAVTQAGLRALIGVTLHVSDHEWAVVIAATSEGYRSLCALVTARHLEPGFALAPYLRIHPGPGLLFLTPCPLVQHQLAPLLPHGCLHRLPTTPAPDHLRSLWHSPAAAKLPELPVPDAWFLEPDDRHTFACLAELRRRGGRPHFLTTPEAPGAVLPAAGDWCAGHPAAQRAVQSLLDRVEFRLEVPAAPLFPRVDLPDSVPAAERLRARCLAGLHARYTATPRFAEARRRLDHELEVVLSNRFADYFLYVNQIVHFAREHDIPVGVRGSAASSMLAYVLEFTHCCPIEYDLYFERFMNPGRTDLPDIDIDIADNRRDEVVEYCYRHWGADRVAMIATVTTYRTRTAVRDAARLLDIPQQEISRFLDSGTPVPRHRELLRIAARLTGLPRHLGVHCGGLVVTPCPLTHVTPLVRAPKGIIVTQFEKDQAEAMGLVKMDLLGNSALSTIHAARCLLAQRGIPFREPGPRHDFKVNRLFARGDTLGVYQCESPGMRQLCRALAPATIKEAGAALSLIRPGPAAAGMKEAFIRRRRGREPVTYDHPRMADFLDDTYGVMLYQEDVMRVAVHLAGYTPGDADSLRRSLTKRGAPERLHDEHNRFVFRQVSTHGVSRETAERIWNQVSQFASYAYCKAHASVYARLAWLTARLKAHHPREFYTAVLNHHNSMYPKRVFVWDAIRHGIPVLPVDVHASSDAWTCSPSGIRAGLNLIRGLRNSTIHALIDQRAQRSFADLADLRRRVPASLPELESLILIGACRSLGPRQALLEQLRATADSCRQELLFRPALNRIPPQLDMELRLTGIPFRAHPLSPPRPGYPTAAELPARIGERVRIIGLLDAFKHVRTSQNDTPDNAKDMSFLTLEDATDMFEAVLFPETHARVAAHVTHAGPYLVEGRVTEQWGSVLIEADGVTPTC